ncbi:MAG TPA: SIMPL domain-containing protein [Candidatus Nanoarchaeia archaeon]|nr:SIMPL domain-containing protein [Candidatus Nanoarchaeia archaeon]
MKKILTLLILGLVLLTACSGKEKSTITADGTATIKIKPDQAVFYISIQTLKDTAEEAQSEDSRISAAVINALKNSGIKEEDIKTQYFNLYKREDWSEKGTIFRGWQADHNLEVKTADIENVGKYLDAAVKNGATGINSINLDLSEEKKDEIFNQALMEAGAEAKKKAEVLAKSVDAKLGKIVSVSQGSPYYTQIFLAKEAVLADSGSRPMPIESGQLEITATINVVYELR